VKVIGQKELLRTDVREMLEKVEERTKDFSDRLVNLCVAYDSIREVESSITATAPQNYADFRYGRGNAARASPSPTTWTFS
jgi:undecaprenyl diphosphate synthase